MAVSTAFLREFVRKVFRDSKESGCLPSETLDRLADAALEASNEDAGSGKIATGITTPEGNAYSWQALSYVNGYNRQIQLIDAARSVAGSATDTLDATRDAAIATIKTVRKYRPNFKGV